MRDPTVKFALKLKDLLALQALANERNQSMARLLRDLVRDATRKGRKAVNTDNETDTSDVRRTGTPIVGRR